MPTPAGWIDQYPGSFTTPEQARLLGEHSLAVALWSKVLGIDDGSQERVTPEPSVEDTDA